MLKTAIPAPSPGPKAPIVVSAPPVSEPVFIASIARAIGNTLQNAAILHSNGQMTDAGFNGVSQSMKMMENLLVARGAVMSPSNKRPTMMGSLDEATPGFFNKKINVTVPHLAVFGGIVASAVYLFTRHRR